MHMRSILALAAVLAITSFSVGATELRQVTVGSLEAFLIDARAVQAEMGEGGRYHSLPKRDKQSVAESLRRMEYILANTQSTADLNPRQSADLFNLQEYVNSVLTQTEPDRQICSVAPRTGSKMRHRECQSARSIARMREEARNSFDGSRRTLMNIEYDDIDF